MDFDIPTTTPDLYILKPCSDLLKITYKNERDEKRYQNLLKYAEYFSNDKDPRIKPRLMKRFSHQVSYIEIPDSLSIIISEGLEIILQPPTIQG